MYRRIRISKIRSDQDSEQINSDLSGNICSKENRLSKINLYRSDQDSEQINSDLSGNICSIENRLTKIILYGSDQDSEWINSDLSGNICVKKTDYLRSLFIDLTKMLNRSIQIYLITFFSKENRLSKITLYRSDQDSEQINSDLSGNTCSKENRLSKITL